MLDLQKEEETWTRQQISDGSITGNTMNITGGRTIIRIEKGIRTPGRLNKSRYWFWNKFTHQMDSAKIK
jgi:hypothetical protein